jgi:hypothetical protein
MKDDWRNRASCRREARHEARNEFYVNDVQEVLSQEHNMGKPEQMKRMYGTRVLHGSQKENAPCQAPCLPLPLARGGVTIKELLRTAMQQAGVSEPGADAFVPPTRLTPGSRCEPSVFENPVCRRAQMKAQMKKAFAKGGGKLKQSLLCAVPEP